MNSFCQNDSYKTKNLGFSCKSRPRKKKQNTRATKKKKKTKHGHQQQMYIIFMHTQCVTGVDARTKPTLDWPTRNQFQNDVCLLLAWLVCGVSNRDFQYTASVDFLPLYHCFMFEDIYAYDFIPLTVSTLSKFTFHI